VGPEVLIISAAQQLQELAQKQNQPTIAAKDRNALKN